MYDEEPQTLLSRRQALLGLGIVGAGMALCSVTGLSGLAYIAAKRLKAPEEYPTMPPTEPPPTATPAIPRPPIVSREDWGAWPPDHTAPNEEGFFSEDNPEGWLNYPGELHESYQSVVLHHAALYENTDKATMLEIQKLHRIDRQWADVAYHFLIGRTGTIYEGRVWTARGTHVAGYNTGSIGVCLLGNFMIQNPTSQQIDSAQRLITWLAYRLQLTHIGAHRHFNPETLCPGDNLFSLLPQFAAAAKLEIGIDGYIPLATADGGCQCCDCAADEV